MLRRGGVSVARPAWTGTSAADDNKENAANGEWFGVARGAQPALLPACTDVQQFAASASQPGVNGTQPGDAVQSLRKPRVICATVRPSFGCAVTAPQSAECSDEVDQGRAGRDEQHACVRNEQRRPVPGPATQVQHAAPALVEPLTSQNLGFFCPETLSAGPAQTLCSAQILRGCSGLEACKAPTSLSNELTEISAMLEEGDAHIASAMNRASVNAIVKRQEPPTRASASVIDGEVDQVASIPTGFRKQSSMQLCMDDFIVQERIGETGGQGGEVFSALYCDPETRSQQRVALKRFSATATAGQRASLEREVRMMALVSSRCHHCVRYWGWCQASDGAICLVMKQYQESLHSKLDSLSNRKMPLAAVQHYGKQIAQALMELHDQRVLFLDLKPSNVLLDEFDNVAVCDFGISRSSCASMDDSSNNCGLVGSFNYMSPEAFDTETFGALSTKSDVWSFACCIVEMVSGRMPWFETSLPAICYKVASRRECPEIPAELPVAVQRLLHECFSHDSNLRPPFSTINTFFDQRWNDVKDGRQAATPKLTLQPCPAPDEAHGCTVRTDVQPFDVLQDQASCEIGSTPNQGSRSCLHTSNPLWALSQADLGPGNDGPRNDLDHQIAYIICYDKKVVLMSYAAIGRSKTLSLQLQQLECKFSRSDQPRVLSLALHDPCCTHSMICKVSTFLQSLLAAEQHLGNIGQLRKVEATLTDGDEDSIFALLLVANFLDIPELTNVACKGLRPFQPQGPRLEFKGFGLEYDFAARVATLEASTRRNSAVVRTSKNHDSSSLVSSEICQSSETDFSVQSVSVLETVHPPAVPQRAHRFTSSNRPSNVRSSPSLARSHYAWNQVHATDPLLSEKDMSRILAARVDYGTKGSSPVKPTFLRGVGILGSLTGWSPSSCTHSENPRPQISAPTNDNHPGEGKTVSLMRRDQLQSSLTKRHRRLVPQTCAPTSDATDASMSIHCTPFVNRGAEPENTLAHRFWSKEGERKTISHFTKASSDSSLLEFRRFVHAEGDAYVGTCKGELKHGIGTCWYANGDVYYGQWRAGVRHGTGRMEWNNGRVYEGAWCEDIMCPAAKSTNLGKNVMETFSNTETSSAYCRVNNRSMDVQIPGGKFGRVAPEPPCSDIIMSAKTRDSNKTRGPLTHILQQTKTMAQVFAGMGALFDGMMSESPPRKSLRTMEATACEQAAQIAAPRRLRFFRVDDHDISKLVEEELIGDEGTSDNKQALKQATALKQIATPEDILYVF